MTLLSYCEAVGISVEECEATEIARILAKPVDEARARYQAKVDAGFWSVISEGSAAAAQP